MSFVQLLCCNDSYIVHYAPVIAPRSRTKYFAIWVNYFLWGALGDCKTSAHSSKSYRIPWVLRPSKFEGHCPMIRHGCRMALMVA
ncbi:MAG: hypothetical protein BECKG1743D_GA0114223_102926, partial [Candidatus Kentron sp. G]